MIFEDVEWDCSTDETGSVRSGEIIFEDVEWNISDSIDEFTRGTVTRGDSPSHVKDMKRH